MMCKARKVVFLFFTSFLILTVGVSGARAFSGGGALGSVGTEVQAAIGDLGSLDQSLSVPMFKQCGQWYSNEQLGWCSNETICSAGCAVCSVAMIFKYYGVDTNPSHLNQWLKYNDGYVSGCLIKWARAADISDKVSWAGIDYSVTMADIKAEIDAGYPCVGKESGRSHFFVIKGYSGSSTLYINDPYFSRTTIDVSQVERIMKYHTPSPSPSPPATSIIKETGSHDIDLHKFSFTQDASGNLHVVFVEKIDDNKGILYYARSTDGGITWQIEGLTTEHMPERAILAVDKNGKAYIAYNDVDYSIPGCHKRDLYAYTNVEGSWKRTLIKEAWNYWGGGEYGYVQYYIPMDIIVDKDNIAHLYARQQGWWAYGGDIWEYTYRNGSWNGPVDTGVGGGVDVDGSNSESFHVNIKRNGDYYAVWADGKRYEGGYWSVNYTYIVQPYLFYGNRSSSSLTGPFSHTQVKSDAVWGVISTLDSENNVYALYNKWPLGTSYEDYAIHYRQGEGPHQFLTTIAFTKNWGNSTEIASMPEWHQLQPRGVVVTKDNAVFILWSHYDYNSSKWNASYYSYQEANGTWHTPIFAGSGISAAIRKNYFATPSTFMYVYVDSHNTSDQKLVFVKYRSTKVLSLKTDKTNYSLGDVVRLEIKLNYTKDSSPVYAKFKLELMEPVGEPDVLFQTNLFPLLPGFNVTKILKFKIPQTFWIPDGEYAFKATLTDSLGREIDSDVARFYVNDTLKVRSLEFDAV